MSKPRKRVGRRNSSRNCKAKQVFQTLEEANKAAYRPGKMNQVWGFMTGYRCSKCKKYHYGHP